MCLRIVAGSAQGRNRGWNRGLQGGTCRHVRQVVTDVTYSRATVPDSYSSLPTRKPTHRPTGQTVTPWRGC